MKLEHCCDCGAATGHAGQGEDSLYNIFGDGPYCDNCWNELTEDMKEQAQ